MILAGDRERRRRLADEHRDGVLERCPRDPEVDVLRAHVLELCLRLRDVIALRHARLVTVARDLERLLVSGHGALEQAEIQVRDAQLKVALREGRLL